MALITHPHFQSGDDFYEALLAAHQDLSPIESQALNARLILLLANHIGQQDVLLEALAAATAPLKSTPSTSTAASPAASNASPSASQPAAGAVAPDTTATVAPSATGPGDAAASPTDASSAVSAVSASHKDSHERP
ncbi:DUF2783 domain-containing protein [Roseateles amylovorans]|uniref:DUF2783 domain-containing protein n=1 Tax=Roseateles amylovorans TaxID=2978473 RepID=UPI003F49717C